jgi:SAM-dependent methyltransferase
MPSRFSGAAAAAYDAGRAPYVPQVVAALGLPRPPARVLDLAAGTGLLSRALLEVGHEVIAVEPDPDMASRLPEGIETHTATAEATGLAPASVDAVVVGDAWHWFDGAAAATEVCRVLRPGGRLALVWRFSVAEERPAALAGFYARLAAARGEHPGFRGARGREALEDHPGFTTFTHRQIAFVHRTSPAGMLAEAASASFVNAMPERDAFLAELRRELEVAGVGAVDVPYVADVWLTRQRPG